MKRGAQVVAGQARIVRLHPAEIPELPANLIETVRGAALRNQPQRSRAVRHAKLAVRLLCDGPDEKNRPQVKEVRIGEDGGDVGRPAHGRLRVGGRQVPQSDRQRQRQNPQKSPSGLALRVQRLLR